MPDAGAAAGGFAVDGMFAGGLSRTGAAGANAGDTVNGGFIGGNDCCALDDPAFTAGCCCFSYRSVEYLRYRVTSRWHFCTLAESATQRDKQRAERAGQ